MYTYFIIDKNTIRVQSSSIFASAKSFNFNLSLLNFLTSSTYAHSTK